MQNAKCKIEIKIQIQLVEHVGVVNVLIYIVDTHGRAYLRYKSNSNSKIQIENTNCNFLLLLCKN
jgi:hypothetical protein